MHNSARPSPFHARFSSTLTEDSIIPSWILSWSQLHPSASSPELRDYQVWSWHTPCLTSKEPIGLSSPILPWRAPPLWIWFQHLIQDHNQIHRCSVRIGFSVRIRFRFRFRIIVLFIFRLGSYSHSDSGLYYSDSGSYSDLDSHSDSDSGPNFFFQIFWYFWCESESKWSCKWFQTPTHASARPPFKLRFKLPANGIAAY